MTTTLQRFALNVGVESVFGTERFPLRSFVNACWCNKSVVGLSNRFVSLALPVAHKTKTLQHQKALAVTCEPQALGRWRWS